MAVYDDPEADRFAKRWNFRPMWYKPDHGLIDLYQIFATPWLTLQLHFFKRPDPSGLYHDHPWSFISFMLRGSYTEKLLKDPYNPLEMEYKRHKRFSLHFMSNKVAHSINACDDNTVTLFAFGPWKRDGFRFYEGGKDFDVSRFSPLPSDQINLMKVR